jgi:RNA polymerase sigma-70 factor (ECF subfamily)
VEPRTDNELLLAHRAGEPGAMEALIRRHHDDLLRFLERLVGDKTAAQDVFQDTFLQVHVSADTFDASRRFKPWLFTIAANKARDLLRKNNRRRTLDLSAPVGGSSGSGGSGDDGQTRFIDLMEISVIQPQDAAQRVELQAAVQAAVQRLSPTLREVLLLAYFQKLSYSQIADALEIPLGTVKSRLHAAVAAFAKSWATSAPAETSDSPSVPPSRPAQSP